VEKHVLRFLVGLRRIRNHPNAQRNAIYLAFADTSLNAGPTNATMEPAHLAS